MFFEKLHKDLKFYPDKIDHIIANGGSLADKYFNDYENFIDVKFPDFYRDCAM